jgi:hypothetical protein
MIAHPPKAINKLIDIGHAIERVNNKRQSRSIVVLYRRRPSLPLILLNAFNHFSLDGCHIRTSPSQEPDRAKRTTEIGKASP